MSKWIGYHTIEIFARIIITVFVLNWYGQETLSRGIIITWKYWLIPFVLLIWIGNSIYDWIKAADEENKIKKKK